MLTWLELIAKYNFKYKIHEKNKRIFIENDKTEIIINKSSDNKMKIITFNIMATRFSSFSKKNILGETTQEMENRYNNIINIISYFMIEYNVDLIFLQETDAILCTMINNICKKTKYELLFSNNIKSLNKRTYGDSIIINTSIYNLLISTNIKITPDKYISNSDDMYSLRKPRSAIIAYIYDTLRNKNIIISSFHLTGIKNRSDIRKDELNTLLNYMILFNKDNIILCGDTNENNYDMLQELFNNNGLVSNNDMYSSTTATSYHKWNMKRELNEYYKEKETDIYQNIDLAITTKNYKKKRSIMFPNHRHGVYGLEVPYNEKQTYDKTKWCSDHALIYIEYEIGK